MTAPSKRTQERVAIIRRGMVEGLTQREIGAQLGICHQAVSKLIRRYILHRYIRNDPSESDLYDRWMTVHDIRSMGERAVRETG